MNEWKSFRKNSDPKKGKNSKNQNEIAACEQKTSSEKENFCSITVVAFYFKIRAKSCTPQTTRFFAPLPVSG